jgi:hypothetical protein
VAIAVSVSIMGAGDWLAARFSNRTATRDVVRVVCGALLLIPLLARSVSIVPEARVYGGSMWFFKPVRPYMDRYDSGRPELRFARFVRNATDRDTGVLVHPAFERYRLEPRFDIALDRPLSKGHSSPTHPPNELPGGVRRWVFIAPVATFSEEERAKLAKIHPYLEVDDHFMLDLRSQTTDVRVWRSRPRDPSLTWTLFHSYAEPPVSWERDLQREHQLTAR